MDNLPDDEPSILARLMPTVQRLQNDSRGLIQWIITLNNEERLALMHWAQRRERWLVAAIHRVPPSTSYTAKPAGRRQRASG